MIRHITFFSRHIFFWSLIIFALGISSLRLFILGVDDYKTDLEKKIYELTSIPLEIGALRVNMRGINPELVLKNINIVASDLQDDHPIQLQEIRLGVNLIKLILTRQILPSSWLTLVEVKLSIVRNKDGKLSIDGLNGGGEEQPLWLLSGGQYEVLKSEISWIDEQRGSPPLIFKDVDLIIKNNRDDQTHEIHLVSHMPEQYGEALRVSVNIQGDVLALNQINGDVYVEANNVNFVEPLRNFLPSDIKISDGEEKGKGSFKLWSHWQKSQLTGLSGIIEASNTILYKKQNTIDIKSLNTEFIGFSKQDSWQLGVNYFDLETKKHVWPLAQLIISGNKAFTHLKSLISQIDLHELSELVRFFAPLEKDKQALIADLNLKGLLNNFSFETDLEKNNYAARGGVERFYIKAHSGMPQMENLTGFISGNNSQGKISLNTKKGALFFPKLLRQPFSIENLVGQVEWQQKPDQWQIKSDSLVFDTKDIQTETRMHLTIPKSEQSIFMDLQTSFSNVHDISTVPGYYPVSIMGKNTVNWLDKAFVSGKIEKGGVLVYGELQQFPFLEGQGVFEVLFNIADVELKFAPGWPNLTQVAADVLFLKNSLAVDIKHAETHNLKVKKTLVEIPSFKTSDRLLMKGQVEGSIADVLGFLQQTPVNKGIDSVMNAIDTKGDTKIELDLKIPLVETAVAEVDGVANFKKAALTVKPVGLNVDDVTGDLKFTEKGLFSNNLTAKTLGYPISISVGFDDVKTTLSVEGKTDSFQLKKQFGFLDNDILKDSPVNSLTSYRVTLDLPVEDNLAPELNLQTTLAGLPIDLPGVLKKSAEDEKPLLINMVLNEQDYLPLRVIYNDSLKAALNINKQQNSVDSAHIVYGKANAVILEEKGIILEIEQDVFDAAEWVPFIKQSFNPNQYSSIKLNEMSLTTHQLQWKGNAYGAFELDMQHTQNQWTGSILSSMAKGRFVIPLDQSPIDQSPIDQTKTDKIKLDMDELDLSGLMQLNFDSEGASESDMPVIDVLSKQLLWRGINLGSLEIEAEKRVDGVRFNRINVLSDNLKVKLSADWIKSEKYSVTELYGDVSATDLGALLSQLDMTNDLKETQADIGVTAAWHGLPYQFSLEAMESELGLTLKEGRISSIDPGFGRLLGLVAMDQWVKRLSLDFGDIYKAGLSFNKVTGDFKMKNGKMMTNDLLVDAVPAGISISGEADLLAKTLNYNVEVVPKSSAAIPIAGTIVGVIAGAITQAIDKDYKEGYFFGSNYNVIGQWDDIKVIPLHDKDGLLKKTWSGLTDVTLD